jgi:hypothetical protein
MTTERTQTEICRWCRAAWPTVDGFPCDHTEWDGQIAAALAAQIHGPNPTDEQVGWFIEDGALVSGYIKEPCELSIRKLRGTRTHDPRFSINGLIFGNDFGADSDGDSSLEYLGHTR